MPDRYVAGVIYCLVATLSWGAMFQVMAGALTRMDPFSFTSVRYLLAGLTFAVVLLLREGWSSLRAAGESLFPAWLFGTAGFAGFNFLLFLGQQMSGASGPLTASIIVAVTPLLSLLFNWAITQVRPPTHSFAFILLSAFGVMLVVTDGHLEHLFSGHSNFRADALMLAGACCWVIYTFGASAYAKWSPLKYTTISIMLSLTSILAINAVLFMLKIIPVPQPTAIVSVAPHLAYMAFVAACVGVLSWNVGNKLLGPMNGMLFINLVPVGAFALSALVGRVPSSVQVLGAAMTCVALIGNNICTRYHAHHKAEAATCEA